MKKTLVSTMTRLCRAFILATLALIGSNALQAQYSPGTNFWNSDVLGSNFGNATLGTVSGDWVSGPPTHQNWAIFALSGGVTITDPSAGGTDVIGNVGIGGAGGLSMSKSYINGIVYRGTGGESLTGQPFGNPYYQSSSGSNNLSQNVTDAMSASSAAGSLGTAISGLTFGGAVSSGSVSGPSGTIALNNISGSITGQAGQTYVINLTDLVLQGTGAVLTLSGTNTTNYVINVSRYMSLAAGAKILLSGTLTAANVLYNVKDNSLGAGGTGTQYDVTLSGGSVAYGTILATTRAVKETGGSIVNGEVIAKTVSLSGASKVINPFASP